MTRGREIMAGATLALFGLVMALALLEVGVRMLHLVPDRLWTPDAELGARLIPKSSGWWTQEEREFVTPIRINAEGLRDVEHTYDKPADTFRILVLGDSFVEAMHVPLEAVFTRQLENELNRRFQSQGQRNIEVIGAGVSGYGTASELLYFRREGRRYHPDLVLLSFYPGNDLKNNSAALEDTLKPTYDAAGELQSVSSGTSKDPSKRGLLARSKAYQFGRQLLLQRQPRLAQWLVAHGLLKADAIRKPPQRDGIPIDFGVYETPAPPEWQAAWDVTSHLLDELKNEAQAAGARFAIMIVSTRDQVYPESWKKIVAANPAMQAHRWDLEAPRQRAEEWCRSRGVACVSMAPTFQATAARGGELLHFAQDGHWTAAGHRLAASTLTEFLLAKPLLEPTH